MAEKKFNAIEQELVDRLKCDSRDEAIDSLVEKWRTRADAEDSPVCLERVAKALRVSSVVYRPLPCDGILRPIGESSYEIHISSEVSRFRQRFSLAHELAHAMIHDVVPDTRSFARRNIFLQSGHEAEERLCNSIAARLLMPKRIVAAQLHDSHVDVQSIQRIASLLCVSLTASAIRVKEVLGIDFALMLASKPLDGQRGSIRVHRMLTDFRRCPIKANFGRQLYGQGRLSYDLGKRVGNGEIWLQCRNVKRLLHINWCPCDRSQAVRWMILLGKPNNFLKHEYPLG